MDRLRGAGVDRLGTMLLATTVAVFVLFLLGIYTAGVGAGLACAGRWPLCDGAVFGLFPANLPSFVEWFHRLFAMLTGLLILASAVSAWKTRAPRRVVGAVGVAVLLLPIQIWAGAQTVLTYELVILTVHFLIGFGIFTAMVTATTVAVAPTRVSRRSLTILAGGGVALVVPFILLGPGVAFVHTGGIQAIYNGVGLLLFTSLLVTIFLVHRIPGMGDATRWGMIGICGTTAAALALKLLVGRLGASPPLQTIDAITSGAVLVGVVLVLTVLSGASLEKRWPMIGRID